MALLTSITIGDTPFALDDEGYVCETVAGRAGARYCEWYAGPGPAADNSDEVSKAEEQAESRLLETLGKGGLSGPLHGEELFIGWHDGACCARYGEPVGV